MHLLMVTETYPPEVNGVALTVQSLAQHMREAGQRTLAPSGLILGTAAILTRGLIRGDRGSSSGWGSAVYVATEGPAGLP